MEGFAEEEESEDQGHHVMQAIFQSVNYRPEWVFKANDLVVDVVSCVVATVSRGHHSVNRLLESWLLNTFFVVKIRIKEECLFDTPASHKIRGIVVPVLGEHDDDVVGSGVIEEAIASEVVFSLALGWGLASMQMEVDFAAYSVLKTFSWSIEIPKFVKTIVRKYARFAQEFSLSKLPQDTLGLPIGHRILVCETSIQTLVQKFE